MDTSVVADQEEGREYQHSSEAERRQIQMAEGSAHRQF